MNMNTNTTIRNEIVSNEIRGYHGHSDLVRRFLKSVIDNADIQKYFYQN